MPDGDVKDDFTNVNHSYGWDTPYIDDTLNAWEIFPDGVVYDYAFISADNSYGKWDYNKN